MWSPTQGICDHIFLALDVQNNKIVLTHKLTPSPLPGIQIPLSEEMF
jgi:hypothetical protein